MTRKRKYSYVLTTLEDVGPREEVFVPNTSSGNTVKIWRWLLKKSSTFPRYYDGNMLIVGIEEDAWQPPKVYRESYCPKEMICIVRRERPIECTFEVYEAADARAATTPRVEEVLGKGAHIPVGRYRAVLERLDR